MPFFVKVVGLMSLSYYKCWKNLVCQYFHTHYAIKVIYVVDIDLCCKLRVASTQYSIKSLVTENQIQLLNFSISSVILHGRGLLSNERKSSMHLYLNVTLQKFF